MAPEIQRPRRPTDERPPLTIALAAVVLGLALLLVGHTWGPGACRWTVIAGGAVLWVACLLVSR